jgi:hypothetical protein
LACGLMYWKLGTDPAVIIKSSACHSSFGASLLFNRVSSGQAVSFSIRRKMFRKLGDR